MAVPCLREMWNVSERCEEKKRRKVHDGICVVLILHKDTH